MTDTNKSIQNYLNELTAELAGQDPALVQDALYDAEQHFIAALGDPANDQTSISDIIEKYGPAKDIAQYYCDIEASVDFALHGARERSPQKDRFAFFTILKDASAYQAIAFSILSLPLGILYFAWTVWVGVISLGASLLIVGMPFFLLYLKSMSYFSLFEGRLIENMLGERMPRRPFLTRHYEDKPMKERISLLIKNRRVWSSALYLALKLPLGMAVFTLGAIPALMSFALILSPIVDPLLHSLDPTFTIDIDFYWAPLSIPAGILGLVVTLHLTKFLAKLQANLAKSMLV
ncbi:membrane protein [Kordiimonas sediminis]|uniref:Membrane protein n=1 Tax=Kordiimonas sediminis TaxID=1735581 RepID=A0A919E459_9PROT|nr:sensor domain-containing protein [Kordiimonas sediminis]GHF11158.1 membrane protein [Kordiimonas sediminis]